MYFVILILLVMVAAVGYQVGYAHAVKDARVMDAAEIEELMQKKLSEEKNSLVKKVAKNLK